MPYALRETGVILGLAGLCLVACMTDYSLILMVKSGQISNTNSYQASWNQAFITEIHHTIAIL